MSTFRFNSLQIALVALLPHNGGFVTAQSLAEAAAIPIERVRAEMQPLVLDNVVAYDAQRDEYEVAGD